MQIHRLVFSPFEVNTYIISDKSKECVIIDPACYNKQEQEYLIKFLKENDLKPVKLLNTHCHLDHVFGNKFVSDTFNLKAEAHKDEDFNISNALNSASIYGLDMDEPYPIYKYLNEGEIIKFGFSELKILHVPGHSAGSLVFYNEQNKFAIVGDVLFNNSIGRTDLPGGDYDTLISQIKTKLFNLQDDTTAYPGHGIATTIGKEKKTNPFLV
ncbi:MAG: MBL fold metallo-hydrolase [Chlorobi bacterium]|nr:MBL fold metallo-hydrolase [Chlorobiota bacterium]